ncbi:SRPBCC family protein [Mycolicibacterium sp. P9-64]|uniref:SRPBCC family protein n=1 Tax=Mycolicibacterium sp. P9-64 TaxID=2024612 RepID=UPI0011ED4659|nr:SRPBCC family protein [Mycolicibacterium sp. P9-64]KAA0079359.1 SRPBCC family protein [Mycolicibacterium sp. P9-64]
MTRNARRLTLAAGIALALYGARRYFRNWGTSKDECRMRLPGDELMRQPVLQSTEGVWIEQSPAKVWPWLVQMGQGRGGLYTYEPLENLLGRHDRNADHIHPEWQHLEPDDVVRLAPKGWMGLREGVALTVAEVIEEQAIVLHVAPPALPWETVWSFHLIPHWDDRCRLIVRSRVGLRHPGEVLVAEMAGPATALMTRGMLRGIRRRAQLEPRSVPVRSASSALSG